MHAHIPTSRTTVILRTRRFRSMPLVLLHGHFCQAHTHTQCSESALLTIDNILHYSQKEYFLHPIRKDMISDQMYGVLAVPW